MISYNTTDSLHPVPTAMVDSDAYEPMVMALDACALMVLGRREGEAQLLSAYGRAALAADMAADAGQESAFRALFLRLVYRQFGGFSWDANERGQASEAVDRARQVLAQGH